jgi:hypothetical protein
MRKRTSVRRLKAKFLAGRRVTMEAVLDNPRFERVVKKYGFRIEYPIMCLRIAT